MYVCMYTNTLPLKIVYEGIGKGRLMQTYPSIDHDPIMIMQ